jgi:glycosyltransferase involved in cell wall biosynthesis
VRAVHQFHPVLAPGDAMSNHVFALRARLREWGYASEAYAVEAKAGVDRETLPYRRLFRTVTADDTLILHFSIGNEVYEQLAKLPARIVLVYHNVTPSEFFLGINPHAATHAALGRRQLAALAPRVDLAIGVSEYNRLELERFGFARTARVPILIDWSAYDVAPDEGALTAWRAGTTLLFVGRVSPNKRHDDLLRLAAYYRRCIDPAARLLLVGSYRDQPQYHARLRSLSRTLGLDGAAEFTGTVGPARLVAAYRAAAAFVSLSEHEGFGVPLLEAMHFGVPIVAYDAAAVRETVGDAGVLLPRKDLAEAAEAIALVLEHREVRDALVAAGKQRLEEFAPDRVATRTREVLGL